MIARVVEPELLDALPSDDPDAMRSRRDLRVINAWMGNARHLTRAIMSLTFAPGSILEMGSGDGVLMLQIARELRRPIGIRRVSGSTTWGLITRRRCAFPSSPGVTCRSTTPRHSRALR